MGGITASHSYVSSASYEISMQTKKPLGDNNTTTKQKTNP